MTAIEKAEALIESQRIKMISMKRINVEHPGFSTSTNGRNLWLVTFSKSKKLYYVSVLNEEEPTPVEALVLAFQYNGYFNLSTLHELLARSYFTLAKLAVGDSAA